MSLPTHTKSFISAYPTNSTNVAITESTFQILPDSLMNIMTISSPTPRITSTTAKPILMKDRGIEDYDKSEEEVKIRRRDGVEPWDDDYDIENNPREENQDINKDYKLHHEENVSGKLEIHEDDELG